MEDWRFYRSDDPVYPEMFLMARVLRGYTQEYVAEQSGISVETLQRYETERCVVPQGDLHKLARGYGFPIRFFQQDVKFERNAHICYSSDPTDSLLAPLQALLDIAVGDEKIANVEWLDDGIYQCHYYTDDDTEPYSKIRLGATVAKAEERLWLLIERAAKSR